VLGKWGVKRREEVLLEQILGELRVEV